MIPNRTVACTLRNSALLVAFQSATKQRVQICMQNRYYYLVHCFLILVLGTQKGAHFSFCIKHYKPDSTNQNLMMS